MSFVMLALGGDFNDRDNLGHRDIEFHRDIDTPLHQKHPTLERYTNNTECDTEEMTFRQTVACVEQRNS